MTDDDRNAIVVCMRVADLEVPHTPSNHTHCPNCGEDCWVDPRIVAALKTEGKAVSYTCVPCFARRVGARI